jgi:hypothetical protein
MCVASAKQGVRHVGFVPALLNFYTGPQRLVQMLA